MITIATDPSVGGTFLAWTLHYLAGHQQYYLLEENSWCDITDTPLGSGNAHGFVPNQPNRIYGCTGQQFNDFVRQLQQIDTATFHTLYFHPFYYSNTTTAAIEYLNNHIENPIIVDSSDHTLYHCSYRKRAFVYNEHKQKIQDDKGILDQHINLYFKDSKRLWDSQNLENTWDLREFMALNFQPFEVFHISQAVDQSRSSYILKSADLWTCLDHTVKDLFNYIDCKIDQTRLEHWQQIYRQWTKNHYQQLMFSTYFSTIIESILNNYDLDLLRFDLDIEQEAAIQHVLIYKHNLNLKTWQLEKFINTKQLYSLLEPNIHNLGS